MNALKNKVQLIGHLGSKLDLKSLESGKSVGNVSLATSEVYKNQKGERVEETIWHNLVVWDTIFSIFFSGSRPASPQFLFV